MISSKLKPCCYTCVCPDVDVEVENAYQYVQTLEPIINCTIYCTHSMVCKTYIESED